MKTHYVILKIGLVHTYINSTKQTNKIFLLRKLLPFVKQQLELYNQTTQKQSPYQINKPSNHKAKMKREGRQHGLVRTYRIMPSPWETRPENRFVNRFESPPTSGIFTKVPNKPTNHSKFTGKCGKSRCTSCHLHPACKSRDKSKGTQKLNSRDLVSNYKLITWRVVDARPGLNLSGFSASGVLDILGRDDYDYDCDNDYELDEFDGVEDGVDGAVVDDDDKGRFEVEDDADEDYVGMVFDQVIEVEEEDWCLVGEI